MPKVKPAPKFKRRPDGDAKQHLSIRLPADVIAFYKALATDQRITLAMALEDVLRSAMPEECDGEENTPAESAAPESADLPAVSAPPPSLGVWAEL